MKRILSSAALALTISSSLFAFDKRVEGLIKDHKLRPLWETSYATEHPDLLPYTQCLVSNYNYQGVAGMFLFVGGESHQPGQSMFCYDLKHRTAFAVPLKFAKDRFVGLGMEFSAPYKDLRTFHNLDERLLGDLPGLYQGGRGSIGFVASVGGSSVSKDGITLRFNESAKGFALGATGGYRRVMLELREPTVGEIYSTDYLKLKRKLDLAMEDLAFLGKKGSAKIESQITKTKEEIAKVSEDRKFSSDSRFFIQRADGGAAGLEKATNMDKLKAMKFVLKAPK